MEGGGGGNLQLRLLLLQFQVVAVDEVNKGARVGLLALHVVPLHVLDVLVACNPGACDGESLRDIRTSETCPQRKVLHNLRRTRRCEAISSAKPCAARPSLIA
jgi:hypothetical protein